MLSIIRHQALDEGWISFNKYTADLWPSASEAALLNKHMRENMVSVLSFLPLYKPVTATND